MNNNTMVLSPGSIGSAMAGTAGQGVWRLIKLMARQPLASLGIIVLCAGGVMASTNALFLQPERHPAPLFMTQQPTATTKPEEEIVPQDLPATLNRSSQVEPSAPTESNTGSAQQAVAVQQSISPVPLPSEAALQQQSESVGNEEVAALQEKLKQMNLFEGEVDGYYGPKTAAAIRAFEMRQGLTPQGALTPQIMTLVQNARVDATRSAPVEPAPMNRPQASVQSQTPAELDPIGQLALEASREADEEEVGQSPSEVMEPQVQPVASVTQTTVPTPKSTSHASDNQQALGDTAMIKKVQEGLVRLGFLHSEIDGVFDQSTARAVREFENYYNYKVTGELAPQLVSMLQSANAFD